MKYNLDQSIRILERTPSLLRTLLSGLNDDWLQAKEGGDSWSPIEIVAHLILGEKTDWIARTQVILESESIPKLEPFDMNSHLQYAGSHSIDDLLSEFEILRKDNIRSLKRLHPDMQDLEKKAIHPELGEVSLKEHLATWLVHDLGHIAQISRVLAKQYRSEVGPWSGFLSILSDRENLSKISTDEESN